MSDVLVATSSMSGVLVATASMSGVLVATASKSGVLVATSSMSGVLWLKLEYTTRHFSEEVCWQTETTLDVVCS